MLYKGVDEEMLTTTTTNTSTKTTPSRISNPYDRHQEGQHDDYGRYQHAGSAYDDASFSSDSDDDDDFSTSSGSMIVYEVDEQEMNMAPAEGGEGEEEYHYEQQPLASSPPIPFHEDDSNQSRINSAIKRSSSIMAYASPHDFDI
eukprot:CAMPEP_0185731858 /NCGR_PEP_ID=MMETSP1171-20130828/14115_1 /TAXON_ID=374046 /ORGANISM="Helicotheca tamensis, Strain CCMP826" /LENGTH=144 /DNA_ID=CAMNT_0028401207 /DNA_START=312 /DNA_END=743 /DNA_ORIENTATION=+